KPHFLSLSEEVGTRPQPCRFLKIGRRMLSISDIPIAVTTTLMSCYHRPVSKHIELFTDDTHVNVQTSELVWNRVLDGIDLDMPIAMHLGFTPHHWLPPLWRQLNKLCLLELVKPG